MFMFKWLKKMGRFISSTRLLMAHAMNRTGSKWLLLRVCLGLLSNEPLTFSLFSNSKPRGQRLGEMERLRPEKPVNHR
jgi:hypothetical protein